MRNDDVEIFAIGTELVTGLILDTNSHWLAGEVAVAGGEVRRITVLADDLEVLTAELRAAVARRARVIITTGGLGPTPDDLTVDAVAKLAGCGVATPPEVLADYARRRGISLEEASTPPRIQDGNRAGRGARSSQSGGLGALLHSAGRRVQHLVHAGATARG